MELKSSFHPNEKLIIAGSEKSYLPAMALLKPSDGLSLDHSSRLSCIQLRSFFSPKQNFAGFAVSSSKFVVLSVSVIQPVRRPCLPQAGLLSKPTTLISERVICTDVLAGQKLEFRYAKQPSKDFYDFIETTPKSEIVAFFRDVAGELEVYRQLQDYHMKIRDGDGEFRVEVHFGEERNGPELRIDGRCIACDPHANLFLGQEPGMESGECVMEEFADQPHIVSRLDYKGRCGFSFTPVRHVQRMSELNDEELFALWYQAVKVLQHSNLPFISMVLNHGTYRTIDHLLLKVWIENYLHDLHRSTWTEDRKQMWLRLQKLALNRPKKQKVCYFFRRNNSCRHGDFCSFLHI